MVATSTTTAIVLTTLMAASQVSALGCYKSGYFINGLHGGKQDNSAEMTADIATTCNLVAGKQLETGSSWTHCSEWALTKADNEDCYDNCSNGCAALPKEYAAAGCGLGCDPNCAKKPAAGAKRHIKWEIKADKSAKKITAEVCKKALQTEAKGCQSGSEQIHDGFWFKFDPQNGGC